MELEQAERALRGAQADYDAARTPVGRAITLMRLREQRDWLAQVQREVGAMDGDPTAPSGTVRYLPPQPLTISHSGTELVFEVCDE